MNQHQSVIDIVNDNKNDKILYLLVFMCLTKENIVKNYTENTNGLFFNITNTENEIIDDLYIKLKHYLLQKTIRQEDENKRNDTINDMIKSLDNSYKKDLDEMLTNKNKKSFSTKFLPLETPDIQVEEPYIFEEEVESEHLTDTDLFGEDQDDNDNESCLYDE